MSVDSSAKWCSMSFNSLISNYSQIQSALMQQVQALASGGGSSATPGKFLFIQFRMSQITQIGDSISNLISQVQSMINAAVRNQKAQ